MQVLPTASYCIIEQHVDDYSVGYGIPRVDGLTDTPGLACHPIHVSIEREIGIAAAGTRAKVEAPIFGGAVPLTRLPAFQSASKSRLYRIRVLLDSKLKTPLLTS